MMLAVQAAQVVVRVVHPPTKEVSVADLILSGLGLTGLILIGSLLLGGVLGAIFIFIKHRSPHNPFNGQTADSGRLHLDGSGPSEP
jgi:hypothetical protein